MRSTLKNPRVALCAMAAVLLSSVSAFAQTPSQYFPITPCRLFDSRQPPGTPLVGQAVPGRQITVKTNCGIPADASALAYNVTVVSPSGAGFLTLYPSDESLPVVSSINFQAGDVRGNGGVVPLGATDPDLTIYLATAPAGGSSHVVLDATGYFKEPAP